MNEAAKRVLPATVQTDLGETALHWAAYNGQVGVVPILIAAGCDPAVRSGLGETPLRTAHRSRMRDMVAALMAEYESFYAEEVVAARLAADVTSTDASGAVTIGGTTARTYADLVDLVDAVGRHHPDLLLRRDPSVDDPHQRVVVQQRRALIWRHPVHQVGVVGDDALHGARRRNDDEVRLGA